MIFSTTKMVRLVRQTIFGSQSIAVEYRAAVYSGFIVVFIGAVILISFL